MKGTSRGAGPPAKVSVRCLCGRVHAFPRQKVLERLSRERWKCSACQRRFVVACTPGTDAEPETFWPIFLEDVPVTGDTQEVAIAAEGSPSTSVPPQLHFQCRCGCRLISVAKLYGTKTRCPKCHLRLVVRVGYDSESGKPIPLLEFLDVESGPEGGRKPGK